MDSFLESWKPKVLSLVRLLAGLLLMQHGLQKMFGLLGGHQVPIASKEGFAGILELGGGFLLAIGLFTRPVAFVLCGLMAVAYFTEHAPEGFFPVVNKGELAVIYCFVYLLFVFTGPGPLSADALLKPRREVQAGKLPRLSR